MRAWSWVTVRVVNMNESKAPVRLLCSIELIWNRVRKKRSTLGRLRSMLTTSGRLVQIEIPPEPTERAPAQQWTRWAQILKL